MVEVKLSFGFVVVFYVFTAARLCYTNNNRFPSSHENVEVEKLLNSLNKPAVKSIKSPDSDIIDCVRISDQPAFDHPLLKNHTIKMRPIYHPNPVGDNKVSSMVNATADTHSSSSITQLWHANGKCPKGTIPIRRTKKEDILRASSVDSYGKKKSFIGKSSFIDVELGVTDGHEYAIASTNNGEFYGSKSALNLWNPQVQESNEFSLTQTWVVGGTYDTGLNTIEAGWQVYQRLYGDTNTRLFIYWTSDAYQKTGCYNLCSGFIQTNNKYAIGGSLSPTSQTDGTQHEFTILIWKDPGTRDWWMQLNGELIGYWPSSLFTHLRKSASMIQWGGEIVNSGSQGGHTSTQMGSGQFPKLWYRKASYVRKVETVDQSNTLYTPEVRTISSEQNCYDILTSITTNNFWGTHFFYGGPGRNSNCQ
ncbi:putative neprosin [Helianthus annuus]|uniref:Neprosin n=1 Tax=Helianthus annuus TaxID=4232 RepID=A0A251T3Q8_HELAN|nr:uncharacterized protein LOC110894407 [Helianthus annuus]KAF5777054.1 putative neprosin [Helianthus annuus]KAJ0492211.1 putative neprosin [Helianthus annuus]